MDARPSGPPPADVPADDAGEQPTPADPAPAPGSVMHDAVHSLRALILAGERYRQTISSSIGLGTTESQAISYLALHGDRGQSDLARDLRLTSSAATALVDRLERQGVAERTRHASDRRRTIVRLTERGQSIATESQQWLVHALERIDADGLETVSVALATIADNLTGVARKVVTGELEAVPTRALPAA